MNPPALAARATSTAAITTMNRCKVLHFDQLDITDKTVFGRWAVMCQSSLSRTSVVR